MARCCSMEMSAPWREAAMALPNGFWRSTISAIKLLLRKEKFSVEVLVRVLPNELRVIDLEAPLVQTRAALLVVASDDRRSEHQERIIECVVRLEVAAPFAAQKIEHARLDDFFFLGQNALLMANFLDTFEGVVRGHVNLRRTAAHPAQDLLVIVQIYWIRRDSLQDIQHPEFQHSLAHRGDRDFVADDL